MLDELPQLHSVSSAIMRAFKQILDSNSSAEAHLYSSQRYIDSIKMKQLVLVFVFLANLQQLLAVKPAFVGLLGSKEGEFRLTQRFKLRRLEAQEEKLARVNVDEGEGGIEGGDHANKHGAGGLERGLGGEDDEDDEEAGPRQGEGQAAGAKMTPEQENELQKYEFAYIGDQEHYYRAPGGSCNTTEQIVAEIAKRNATGTLNRYWQHTIERRKCLYYEKTQCTLVPSKANPKVLEPRCVCKPGRTWESGSCLAYHGQPCIWQNDCVVNAKCKFPQADQAVEEEAAEEASDDDKNTGKVDSDNANANDDDGNDANSEESGGKKEEEAGVDLGDKVEFQEGVCECETFSACQREATYPPFRDDSKGALLYPWFEPYFLISLHPFFIQ